MRKPSRTRLSSFHLQVERLEDRVVLSGTGLVPVGTQPVGALSGKIVYTHAGHGWTADNLGNGAWTTQRPETFEMVEDLGNVDQMAFLADYLFRAGATVVPLRPVGQQPNEVILDNDDPGVSFVGTWTDSTTSVYFGSPGDVPYRFAGSSATETAYARYQPTIPEEGFYPVYAWTKTSANRVEDQLYRINHTGGTTEVTVDHTRVGDGPVYLGTYYFDAGADGYVDISNRSSDAGVVVADMVRFGNGVGDIDRGGGVSGKTRTDEAGLYWVKWHVDNSQGIPDSEYRTASSDRDATVSLSPRYAEFMNNASSGSLSDRVFVSFHSNAGGSRGVLGLLNGNNNINTRTPNQFLLADTVASEVNDDLVAQNGQFEHNWFDRGNSVTLDRSDIEFGEINNTYINDEFDATIIETGYHDNQFDAELLRDARVRDALARATYQGLVKYFGAVDGGATPQIMLPGEVSHVRAQTVGTGSVQLQWRVPMGNSYEGDDPTGFMIYTSLDGYGFDGGTFVPDGSTTSFVMDGLDPANGAHYFKVAAVNAGGESKSSETIVAIPRGAGTKVLVVNGFDRLDRSLNPREPYFSGQIDRVRPRQSNSFDYSVQVGEAIESYGASLIVDSASNDAVIAGGSLSGYSTVVWILGEESTSNETFDSDEQFLVSSFLAVGGRLFVSGAETGWDLDNLGNGQSFYNNQLRANYVADDANTYSVLGTAGSIFSDLSFTFDDGDQFYDAQFPDVIAPNAGSVQVMSYLGGAGGVAGVAYTNPLGFGQLVNLGFPFETITTPADRAEVMSRALTFFGLAVVDGDFDDNGLYECHDVDALVVAIVDVKNGGVADLAFDLTGDGDVTNADLDAWLAEAGAAGLTNSGDPILVGDADLNGSVDGQDFIAWNANKFTSVAAWCSGDFNADGFVDGQDFVLWNVNKFTSADTVAFRRARSPFPTSISTPREMITPLAFDRPHVAVDTPLAHHLPAESLPPITVAARDRDAVGRDKSEDQAKQLVDSVFAKLENGSIESPFQP